MSREEGGGLYLYLQKQPGSGSHFDTWIVVVEVVLKDQPAGHRDLR